MRGDGYFEKHDIFPYWEVSDIAVARGVRCHSQRGLGLEQVRHTKVFPSMKCPVSVYSLFFGRTKLWRNSNFRPLVEQVFGKGTKPLCSILSALQDMSTRKSEVRSFTGDAWHFSQCDTTYLG